MLVSQSVTRWLHDGYAKASRSRVAIARPSASTVCPSYCHRVEYTNPVSPMTTRSKDDGYTNPQDVHTMVSRWPHGGWEGHTKSSRRSMHLREDLRQFFDMPKILWTLPKLLPNPKKLSPRSHDGLGCSPEWPDVFTIIPDVANFLHRVSIGSQHRDSVTPA